MGIEIVQEGPVVVVAPDGDLSRESRREVKQTLEGFLDKRAARIVVDLSRVAYIDSTIWGELAAAGKRAREAGGELRLCAMQEHVLSIYTMIRLSRVLAVYPTRESAMRSPGTVSRDDSTPARGRSSGQLRTPRLYA